MAFLFLMLGNGFSVCQLIAAGNSVLPMELFVSPLAESLLDDFVLEAVCSCVVEREIAATDMPAFPGEMLKK